jgi:hypothetical protein
VGGASGTPPARFSGIAAVTKKIRPGYILPSAAYTISSRQIRFYAVSNRTPKPGDVVYARVSSIGQHGSLENKQGRIHQISDGTHAVFVFGNRYAPDAFEGFVPKRMVTEADVLARSGMIGQVREKNAGTKDPTKVNILGYVVDSSGTPLNTMDYPIGLAKNPLDPRKRRAKMILHVGTSMNSGKSTSAVACCWALAAMGRSVRASKVTGTSSLKDILHMQDAGAEIVSDFSHLGHPSTYMLDFDAVIEIFKKLDAKIGNNPQKFWVVEFADGILQRETAALLRDEYVRSRIHRLVFSASDAFGAIGGLRILREEFDLTPDAISGRCTSSPLMIRELQDRTKIPIYNNMIRDLRQLSDLLL